MEKTYFTVGPSQLYPTVRSHIKTALEQDILSISHRSPQFQQIYQQLDLDLKSLLSIPRDWPVFFVSSGTEAMERILQGCVLKHSRHLVAGVFSKRFSDLASMIKKSPQIYTLDAQKPVDFSAFLDINGAPTPELICLTHNETSTGFQLSDDFINQIKSHFPKSLVVVDVVSSAPAITFDASCVDAIFFSVQKGFGLPSGLGVLVVNQACIDKANWIKNKGESVGSYHSILKLHEKYKTFFTLETPNVFYIYLLHKVIQDMLSYTHAKLVSDQKHKAQIVYDYFSKGSPYCAFVDSPDYRAKATIVIKADNPDLPLKTLAQDGLILSAGYGDYKASTFRIANYPTHTVDHMSRLIRAFASMA